jgi:hypothetical protein
MQRVPAQRIWNLKHIQSKQAAVETVNTPIIKNIIHRERKLCKQNIGHIGLKDSPNDGIRNGNKTVGVSAAWRKEQRGEEGFKESGIG